MSHADAAIVAAPLLVLGIANRSADQSASKVTLSTLTNDASFINLILKIPSIKLKQE